MRFGLERMRRLLTVLGSPQERLRAIHVVGTNGKSSTVRMIAAILEASGLRTGAYLSPHLSSYAERIRIGDADLAPDAFGAAIQRAAAAAAKVDRTSGEDDRVTQFELLTAAALDELARREVDVAVIEAGLGGRWDATNVLGAPVVVLTNVGLDHTRWLGPTIADIAGEKLAVVRADATLVLGDTRRAGGWRRWRSRPGAQIVRAAEWLRTSSRLPGGLPAAQLRRARSPRRTRISGASPRAARSATRSRTPRCPAGCRSSRAIRSRSTTARTILRASPRSPIRSPTAPSA